MVRRILIAYLVMASVIATATVCVTQDPFAGRGIIGAAIAAEPIDGQGPAPEIHEAWGFILPNEKLEVWCSVTMPLAGEGALDEIEIGFDGDIVWSGERQIGSYRQLFVIRTDELYPETEGPWPASITITPPLCSSASYGFIAERADTMKALETMRAARLPAMK